MMTVLRKTNQYLIQKSRVWLDSYLQSKGAIINSEDEALIEDIVSGRQSGVTMDEKEFNDFHQRMKEVLEPTQDELNEKEAEICNMKDERVMEICLNGFYDEYNPDMIPKVSSIVRKYIDKPQRLIEKLQNKYGKSLYEYCPVTTDSNQSQDPSIRLSAWEAHQTQYIIATLFIIVFSFSMLFTIPLEHNANLATKLDIAFLLLLAVGAMNMQQFSALFNGIVFTFSGCYVVWLLARKWSQQHLLKNKLVRKRRPPRPDWFNY